MGSVIKINSLGDVPLQRGLAPASIGENINGAPVGGSKGQILCSWDEIVGSTSNQIVVVFKSSDQQSLFPFNLHVGAENFTQWTWNVGLTDPVSWRNNVAAAPLIEAKVQLSSDSGQTYFATIPFTANVVSPWIGKDFGATQTDTGINLIRLTYTVGQVPAPGFVGVFGLCTMGAAHRRKR